MRLDCQLRCIGDEHPVHRARCGGQPERRPPCPSAHVSEIRFGKQSWYGPLSGIWQSVWLERRARSHLSRVRIDADRSRQRLSTGIRLAAHRALYQKALRRQKAYMAMPAMA
jgi:hypothetical protein